MFEKDPDSPGTALTTSQISLSEEAATQTGAPAINTVKSAKLSRNGHGHLDRHLRQSGNTVPKTINEGLTEERQALIYKLIVVLLDALKNDNGNGVHKIDNTAKTKYANLLEYLHIIDPMPRSPELFPLDMEGQSDKDISQTTHHESLESEDLSLEDVLERIQRCNEYESLALRRIFYDFHLANFGRPQCSLKVKRAGTKVYFYKVWTDPSNGKMKSEYLNDKLPPAILDLLLKKYK